MPDLAAVRDRILPKLGLGKQSKGYKDVKKAFDDLINEGKSTRG